MTKLDKILKAIPVDVAQEMQGFSPEDLKAGIIKSEQAIEQARDELDNSPEYQRAKEDVSILSASYRELKKYQAARIQYALILLNEKGS